MNFLKFFSAILVLILALVMQSWFSVWGFYGDFVFTALIVFAFLFDFFEFLILVLFSIFLINWQPAPSVDITAFALLPFVVYSVRRWFHWDTWIGSTVSIPIGILLLYLFIAPASIIHSFGSFFLSIVLSLVFGELILWGMVDKI